jgi:hypothetical protein
MGWLNRVSNEELTKSNHSNLYLRENKTCDLELVTS